MERGTSKVGQHVSGDFTFTRACPGSEKAEFGDNRQLESRLRSGERLCTRPKATGLPAQACYPVSCPRQLGRLVRTFTHGTEDIVAPAAARSSRYAYTRGEIVSFLRPLFRTC